VGMMQLCFPKIACAAVFVEGMLGLIRFSCHISHDVTWGVMCTAE
jgi:hypothetical protein